MRNVIPAKAGSLVCPQKSIFLYSIFERNLVLARADWKSAAQQTGSPQHGCRDENIPVFESLSTAAERKMVVKRTGLLPEPENLQTVNCVRDIGVSRVNLHHT